MPEDSKLRTVFIPYNFLDAGQQKGTNSLSMGSLSNGRTVELSVAEAQKLQLGQTFASVRQITEACSAIHNTQFTSVMPKPDWYDELNGKFNIVKRYAREWLDDHAIAVTATIPNSVITFTPTFDASADVIKGIINRTTGDISPSDLVTVRDVLARLVGKVDSISQTVNTYARIENGVAKGKLVTWQQNMREAGIDLKSGSATIQNAATSLTDQITIYNGKVKALRDDIDRYNTLIALGAGLVVTGAIVSVVGAGLCIEFPVAGGIVLLLGVGMLIGGAVTWGVFQNKLNKASREIIEYQHKITENNKTIVALNTLSGGVDQAISNANSAVSNMTNFAASWLTFSNSLKETIYALERGGSDATKILLAMDMETAREQWDDVKGYAKGLLEVPTEVKIVPAGKVA
jgi:hypothetical protein